MFELFENPTIDRLLRERESQLFDRVSGRIDWADIGNLVMGFANADGGVLLVGVEKDKAITGLEDVDIKQTQIRKAACELISPPVAVAIKRLPCLNHKSENSNLLLVEVPQSNDVHSNQKDEVYLRVGDENKKLNYEQRVSLLDERGKISFELVEAKGATINDLDDDSLENYRQALHLPGISAENLLIGRDLARTDRQGLIINMAGILLFGKKPERWIERARVRVLRYEGIIEKTGERFNVIKDVSVCGPLPYQIKGTQEVLKGILREFTVLDPSGRFITQPEYPEFAWKEAIVNALVHRAYVLRGADIQVKMFDDHLEIISPGRFPGLVNEKNIKDTHYSRNPRIARVIAELGFIRELGEGVNRIIDVMKEMELPMPIFTEKANSEVLVQLENNIRIRSVRKETESEKKLDPEVLRSLPALEQKIIIFMIEHGKITTKECENLVRKHRTTVIRHMNFLRDREFIKRVGEKGPKIYYILGSKLTAGKGKQKAPGTQEMLFDDK